VNVVDRRVLRDAELVQLLGSDPELLAIADAVQSTQRRSRSRLVRIAVAAAAAMATIAVAAPALGIDRHVFGLFGGEPVRTEQLSDAQRHVLGAMASGVSPRIPLSAQADLERARAAHLRKIAERDGRAYFVSDRKGGGLCVTIRSVADPSGSWGYTCSPDFPSAARPLLDESVFWGLRGETVEPRIVRLEGFADDSVASVGVLSADGRVEAVTPVQDNVYLRTDDLPVGAVGGIVALDANGARVYDECYVRGGCSPP
jgi:hypothetical protein